MNNLVVSANSNILKTDHISFEERQMQLNAQAEKEKTDAQKAKKSPYTEFIQVNKAAYKKEDWLMSKSPVAYRIFRFLCNNMDNYNAVICSYKVLQEVFDVSQATIARAVKILKENQYIDIYRSGTSNVYCINKEIVWNSWGTNFKYAKFSASVVLSEREQDQKVKTKTKKLKTVELENYKLNKEITEK